MGKILRLRSLKRLLKFHGNLNIGGNFLNCFKKVLKTDKFQQCSWPTCYYIISDIFNQNQH